MRIQRRFEQEDRKTGRFYCSTKSSRLPAFLFSLSQIGVSGPCVTGGAGAPPSGACAPWGADDAGGAGADGSVPGGNIVGPCISSHAVTSKTIKSAIGFMGARPA
jgi:hypothetical protein